jgi:hypothetical protein
MRDNMQIVLVILAIFGGIVALEKIAELDPAHKWIRCVDETNDTELCTCIFGETDHPSEKHITQCEREWR